MMINSTLAEKNALDGCVAYGPSSSPSSKHSIDLFDMAKANDFVGIERIIDEEECCPDDKDDMGRTALHICAYHGHDESTQKLISLGASLNVPDFESGWTPLHRALYHGHLKVSLLLIKAGASMGDNWRSSNDDWKTVVQPKKEPYRSIKNIAKWKCPIDHDGLSPLDLLSYRLMDNLKVSKKLRSSTSIHAFGKSDFMLGVPLPRASDIVRPKRLEKFAGEDIHCVKASKHHSMALTINGDVYAWGHGRSGRLGLGDENTHPVPTIIEAFVSKSIKIKAISTAENHSLAISANGDVYSWGSDRYGQLGHNGSDNGMSLTPRRIDYLKKMNVLCVAAGTTHSLCFTDEDHIYAWGSNKHAQLGIRSSESTSLSNGSGPGSAVPKRLSLGYGNLGNATHGGKLITISLAAGTYNSLVLVKNPDLSNFGHISLNEVYQWGHGCVSPMKVHFNNSTSSCRKERSSSLSRINRCDDSIFFGPSPRREILNISAGLNHNCAVSSDGHLYTWGLGSDQLGHGEDGNVHQLSSPQLVEALLPENGGGRVVQVSASNSHTCVVTDKGDVYSWGSSIELPESSATFQPVPRRVVGIKRAVQVASGADHTVVLCTASLPPLPHGLPQPSKQGEVSTPLRRTKNLEKKTSSTSSQVLLEVDDAIECCGHDGDNFEAQVPVINEILSLKQLCEIQIAKSVDISNVANVLEFATQFYSTDLTAYCSSFILKNLDGVLMQCRPNDLDTLISDTLETHHFRRHSSGSFGSVGSCERGSPRLRSGTAVSESDMSDIERDADNIGSQRKRRSSLSRDDMTLEGVTRFVKQTKKRLLAIYELEKKLDSVELLKETLQAEQIAKLERKTILESELRRVELIMIRLENEQRLKMKAKVVQNRLESEMKEKLHEISIPEDKMVPTLTCTELSLQGNELNDGGSVAAMVCPSTKRSKSKKQIVSLTSMLNKSIPVGRPPSSFAEWLNVPVIAQAAPAAPFSSSSSVWGKANSDESTARINLKDVISSQAEESTKLASSPSIESVISPTNACVSTDCVSSQSTPISEKKSGGGKKVKVSLAEFMDLSEKKNMITTKPAPWSASKPKVTDNGISSPSSHLVSNLPDTHIDSTSTVVRKLSFAQIQQQEEELRKHSNIKSLKGNENPWFIARTERAESLDKIMAKQSSEDSAYHSLPSSSVIPEVNNSGVKLSAAAAEFTPSILSSPSESKSTTKKGIKIGNNKSSKEVYRGKKNRRVDKSDGANGIGTLNGVASGTTSQQERGCEDNNKPHKNKKKSIEKGSSHNGYNIKKNVQKKARPESSGAVTVVSS